MRTTGWMQYARVAVAVLLLATVACEDETSGPDDDGGFGASVDALQLKVNAQTLTLYSDGKITLGPLVFFRPNAPVTVTLLDRNGSPIQNVDPSIVQVNIGSQSNNVVNFSRTNEFSGTLVAGTNAGSTFLFVALFDKVKRKAVFGPYPVPVQTR